MPTTADFEDSDWKIGRGQLLAGSWQHSGSQRISTYRHPLGHVAIFEYGVNKVTSMQVLSKGRMHCRRWEAVWGDKTLARLARELIEEVVR